jgi:hypothetical protein
MVSAGVASLLPVLPAMRFSLREGEAVLFPAFNTYMVLHYGWRVVPDRNTPPVSGLPVSPLCRSLARTAE